MITANDNGILHTLGTVSENNGGVLYEINSVHTNDGGVLKEIFHASRGATVEGITPLVVADDHIVIVDSGSFTLSAPAGARIIVGGGATSGWVSEYRNMISYQITYTYCGGLGGYVACHTLESAIYNAQCTLTLGEAVYLNTESISAAQAKLTASTLTINGITYDSGTVRQIIQSKWGPIGGNGGTSYRTDENGTVVSGSSDGTGAGGGGGGAPRSNVQWKGGNNGGYGNFGGNGGTGNSDSTKSGKNGSSGAGGAGSKNFACGGGGGGFSAGGGLGSSGYVDSLGGRYVGSSGRGGAGIIVIEWDN